MIASTDTTADSVHVFANLPVTMTDSEIMAMANAGGGSATRVDTSHFKSFISGLGSGNNVFTVVTFEQTGTSNIQRLTGNMIEGLGAGLGDLNYNGVYDVNDVDTFSWFMGNEGSEFSPSGDLDGDGIINFIDYTLLGDRLVEVGADAATMAAYAALANTSPTATDDSFGGTEDAQLVRDAAAGVLANDSDPDWQALTANLLSGPSHAASFSLAADGSFSYTPNGDFNGSDSFTYEANDGYGGTDSATVTFSIAAVNDPPVLSSASRYGLLDVPVDVDLSQLASDTETATASLSFALEAPSGGTAELLPDGYTARFTPDSGHLGGASFSYRATDTGDGADAPITSDAAVISLSFAAATPPSAALAGPLAGSIWPVSILNAQGHIDVAISDALEGVDVSSIDGDELSLSGTGLGSAVLDGTVSDQGGGNYRYAVSGAFSPGLLTVTFLGGSFADQAGALNDAQSLSLLVIADPPVTPGGNVSAPAILEWFETSWATMTDRAADLFSAGYGGVWTPPPGRAIYTEAGGGIGYDVYDRFDLGSA
ncbi:MAG TPA: Ig-like domain-containing protein, partial [Pirellulales bacterium]|nr:Ig-like domain-containing protein [Pirellulales bacterium]